MNHIIDHAIVDVLVIKDNKFLLTQEGRPGRDGLYNIPGGHIDGHETIFQAAVREVKEESGYDVEITGFIGVYQGIYPALNVSGPVLSAKVIGGEATTSAEHKDVIWVTKDELFNMAKTGKLFTPHPPFAVNHYLTRGALTLDYISSYEVTPN